MKEIVQKFVLEGYADIEVRDAETGRILQQFRTGNIITNLGMERILDLMLGEETVYIQYQAIGDSIVAPGYTDVDLGNEFSYGGYARKQPTTKSVFAITGGGANGYKGLLKYFWTRSEGWDGITPLVWKEIGMFHSATGSNCCSRLLLASTITKDDTVTVSVTWNYIIKNG